MRSLVRSHFCAPFQLPDDMNRTAAGLPSNLRSDLPVLFLWGTRDPTATPTTIRRSAKFVPRLQDIALEDKGHWLMVEAKDEVTRHIVNWLKGLGSPSTRAKL